MKAALIFNQLVAHCELIISIERRLSDPYLKMANSLENAQISTVSAVFRTILGDNPVSFVTVISSQKTSK